MNKLMYGSLITMITLFTLLTTGCHSIPKPPERNEELASQCADWNYRQSLRLTDAINQKKSYPDILDMAIPLQWGTQAVSFWVGKPEKDFHGDIKKLAHAMDEEDTRYRKQMTEWKEDVAYYGNSGFSFSTLLMFCLLGSILGIVFLLAIFKKLFM